MHKSDFDYRLPAELIAQRPAEPRSASRLLMLDGSSGATRDLMFTELPDLLRAGDMLVFNDTRVIPARLFARKSSGGAVEILVERLLSHDTLLAMLRASKSPRPGQDLTLDDGTHAQVLARRDDMFELRIETADPLIELLERIGHVPLPPYIERADDAVDRRRYQTVYARRPGAVAAPTAGLHFDEPLLRRIAAMSVEQEFVTLHVGAGTFQPLRVDDIREHRMHQEYIEVSAQASERINRVRARGGRVIAVGTTAVRVLESVADEEGVVAPYQGETDIFIYPGYRFRAVDAMITNFHLPESTLLMLVCAFAGKDQVLAAYRHAVGRRYRFFSYGDAMFVLPRSAG